MTFEDLDLIEPIRKALVQEGYTTPTPIQSEAIPIVSQGYDLLGCAQTGTGKTAAFSIPIIQRLYLQKKKGYKRGIKALILTPTRELAIQIGESFAAYGRFAGLRHTVIFGGVGQKPQTEALERGIDILIATPGRLLDLIGQGFIHLDTLEYFVLDEASAFDKTRATLSAPCFVRVKINTDSSSGFSNKLFSKLIFSAFSTK